MTNLIIAILLSLNICLNPCCFDDVEFVEEYGMVTSGTVIEKRENFIILEIDGQLENWYLEDEIKDLEVNEDVLIIASKIVSKKDLIKGIDYTTNNVYN